MHRGSDNGRDSPRVGRLLDDFGVTVIIGFAQAGGGRRDRRGLKERMEENEPFAFQLVRQSSSLKFRRSIL